MQPLQTERLLLRPWHPEEWQAFFNLHADPMVAEWLGGALSADQAQSAVAAIHANYRVGYGVYALCLADGTLIGAAGLQQIRADMPFCGIEATWRLQQSAQGQGYATEAMRAVLADARDRLKLNHIHTYTSRGNVRSQSLMRRIGFVADPAQDFDHPKLPEGHPLRAHVYYEWRAP